LPNTIRCTRRSGSRPWWLRLIATPALSVALWVGWRLVGATRHHATFLAVLLYQSGVLHIAFAFAAVIVFFGMDLGSRESVGELIEFMQPGQSLQAGFDAMSERVGVLVAASEVRVAFLAAVLVASAGGVWLLAGWGAYRDALGSSRMRSFAALAAAGLVLWASGRLLALVSWRCCRQRRSRRSGKFLDGCAGGSYLGLRRALGRSNWTRGWRARRRPWQRHRNNRVPASASIGCCRAISCACNRQRAAPAACAP
jgi:hypothetical protein